MPRNEHRYPHTPEGVAQRERDMTKNCQPVGLGQRSRKLFTKEKFLEDISNENKNSTQKSNKNTKKRTRERGDGIRNERTIKDIARLLIEYSLKEDSLDVHGFLRSIELGPQRLYEIMKSDQILAEAYDKAKSNFAYNNLTNLMTPNANKHSIAMNKHASLHSSYSTFLKAERQEEKAFEKKLTIEMMREMKEEQKNMPIPEQLVKVEVVY